jgi:hypothetical protein
MANLKQLKDQLDEARFVLNQQQYSLNQEKYGTPEFKTLEKKVKDTRARIATLQTAYNKAKKPIDAAKNAKTKTADLKTIADLQIAKEKALAVNPQADVSQIDADIAALEKKQNIETSGSKQAFDYSTLSINQDGSVQDATGPGYLIVTPKGKDNQVEFFKDASKARKAFIDGNYTTPNGIDVNRLKNDLLKANYITEEQAKRNDYVSGIDAFLSNYTKHQVQDINLGGSKSAASMVSFLTDKSKGLSGSGGNKPLRYITLRSDAKKDLDTYLTDLIGRPSTIQEEEDYYRALHKAESASSQMTVDGTTTGRVLQDSERLLIAASVAKKSLKGMDIEQLLSSKKGSQVATNITQIQKLAATYGIPMDSVKALSYVRAGLGTKDALVKQEQRLRQLSIQLHPNLKDHLMAGGTVKDVADVYATAKFQKLGVAIPNSTADASVMAAVRQGKTIDQYNQELQSDPLWRRSDEARNTATQFANTILSSFGFGG